ncbi:MAG: hypothetical protein AAF352_02070, partial [Pseudomonadota bacterium]
MTKKFRQFVDNQPIRSMQKSLWLQVRTGGQWENLRECDTDVTALQTVTDLVAKGIYDEIAVISVTVNTITGTLDNRCVLRLANSNGVMDIVDSDSSLVALHPYERKPTMQM